MTSLLVSIFLKLVKRWKTIQTHPTRMGHTYSDAPRTEAPFLIAIAIVTRTALLKRATAQNYSLPGKEKRNRKTHAQQRDFI